MSEIYLSIIIPARNEAKRISGTLLDIDQYLKEQGFAYEIIVVANDCTDNTLQVVDDLKKTEIKHLVVLDLGIGFPGKGFAVQEGTKYASGKFIMFMDADNSTKINEIEKFLPYLEKGFEIVIGSRHIKGSNIIVKQPIHRRFFGRAANLLIQALLLPGVSDTQCGFKVFSHNAAKKIFGLLTVGGWLFDTEVLTLAKLLKYKIKQVPVAWHDVGESKLKAAKTTAEVLKALYGIKKNVVMGKYKI